MTVGPRMAPAITKNPNSTANASLNEGLRSRISMACTIIVIQEILCPHEPLLGNVLLEYATRFTRIFWFVIAQARGPSKLTCHLLLASFERLLAIKETRTPRTLRIFLDWALVIGVLILSPQFARLGLYGIFTSFLIMCFLIKLIKIQKILEYPFGKNMDHIDLRMRNKTFKRII